MEKPETGIPVPVPVNSVPVNPLQTDFEVGSEAIHEMESSAHAREAISALFRF